jgi:hypothetical protein
MPAGILSFLLTEWVSFPKRGKLLPTGGKAFRTYSFAGVLEFTLQINPVAVMQGGGRRP